MSPPLSQPLFLDIGCGYGRFLLQLSRSRNDFNFVGMEVRRSPAPCAGDGDIPPQRLG